MKFFYALFLFVFGVMLHAQDTGTYEGFFKKDNNGTYFFYEMRNDSILPLRKVVFKGVDANLVKTSVVKNHGESETHSVVIMGIKDDEKVFYDLLPYTSITITEVKDLKGKNVWDFYIKNQNRIAVPCVTDTFEGYYHNYGREYVFQDKRYNYGKIEERHSLVVFKDDNQMDNVLRLAKQSNQGVKCYHTDAFIKVKATLFYGNIFEYGYYTPSQFLLKVDHVLSVDRKKTYNDFLIQNLIKGYVCGNDTIYPPNDFAIGKTYRYTATAKDTLGVYNIKVAFTKKSALTLAYKVNVVRNKKEKYAASGNFTLTVPVYLPGSALFNNRFRDTHYMYLDAVSHARIYVPFSEGIKSHLTAVAPPPNMIIEHFLDDFSFTGLGDVLLTWKK